MRSSRLIIPLLVLLPLLPAQAQPAAELLKMERIFRIHLHITREQWQMMQPTRASRLATVLGVSQHSDTASPHKDAPYVEGERIAPSGHGYEYAYVRAAVQVDGERFADIGLRFKGNGSYGVSAGSMRRPMKLDFDRFVPHGTYHGLKTLDLRNNALDPTNICESVSYAVFRDAQVPAPLTSLALVYLTIDGQTNREFLGLYTLVEDIDKRFLERCFGNSDGLLLKPEITRSFPYLGRDWHEYERYDPKNDGTPAQQQRFIELTRLINSADDADFRSGLEKLMDVDEFLRYIAVNVALVNTDSFLQVGHNFDIYARPDTGRMVMLPWDLNYSFGSWGRDMDTWTGLSIRTPYRTTNLFAQRVLEDPVFRARYYRILHELCDGAFSPEHVHQIIARMEHTARRAMAISAAAGRPTPTTMPTSPAWTRPDLREFVTRRVEVIRRQLAAEEKADAASRPATPTPAATPKAPARAVRPAAARRAARKPNRIAPPLLRAIDANREGQLSPQELRDAARHLFIAMKRYGKKDATATSIADTFDRLAMLVLPFPPSLPDAPATRPGGPSLQWAEVLVRLGDADHDGELSEEELLALIDRTFATTDRNKDGLINTGELGIWMDSVVPR